MIYLKLSKSGYGTVNEIEAWGVEKVVTAIEYEKFCGDYEAAFMDLNKPE